MLSVNWDVTSAVRSVYAGEIKKKKRQKKRQRRVASSIFL